MLSIAHTEKNTNLVFFRGTCNRANRGLPVVHSEAKTVVGFLVVIFPVTESLYWMYSLAIPQAEISRVEYIVLEFSSF
jgi:hypothetical protein